MAVEQFTNGPSTVLDGAIDDTVTTLDVTSFANFPSSPNYRIRIDSEIMLVTAGAGTLSWTVTRGAEGTTAAAHSDSAVVTHVLTADAVAEFRADNCIADTYANRPAAGKEGRIFIPTDGRQQVIQRDNGVSWDSYGPIRKFTVPPSIGSLTWVNQETATVTQDSSILIQCPTTGSFDKRQLVKTMGAAPWTLKIACKGYGYPGTKFGLVLRESSSGATFDFGPIIDTTQPPTLSARRFSPSFHVNSVMGDPFWIGLGWDGTNAICYLSENGGDWMLVNSEVPIGMTPDQIGIFIDQFSGNTTDSYVRVFSWEEE